MYRKSIKNLENWKNRQNKKPLLLLGARQVGKTWLMKEFGKNYYKKVAYLRFDRDENLKKIFSEDYNIERILLGIQSITGFKITADDTLLIFDEIQECPRALTSLKYFYEDAPEYNIIAAGSMLGVSEHTGTGFPVGKIETEILYPLNFEEFLLALKQEQLIDLLHSKNWKAINSLSTKFSNYLRYYYFIGGMPEVVQCFIDENDFKKARKIQQQILFDYYSDFSKHAPKEIVPSIKMIWDSIPVQLARENKKFIYNDVKKKSRAKTLRLPIEWLIDAGLIYLIPRINKSAIPLDAYRDGAFKAFFLDIGLLGAKSKLSPNILIEGNRVFQEFKGALAEQYVLQELISNYGNFPYYWASESSRAEVDFVLQNEDEIIPIEVKAERNLQAKSLKVYYEKFKPRKAFRISMSDYNKNSDINNSYELFDYPLYSISVIFDNNI